MYDTPYGNYSSFDPEPHWSDDFYPTSEQTETIRSLFETFLEEAAAVCHLDTSEWDSDDYDILKDVVL